MSKSKPDQPKPPEGASPAVEPEAEVASPAAKESGAEESLRLIYAATEEVAQTESEMLDAKEKAKNRTKLWEAAVERQQQVIRKCQAGPGPLFAKAAEPKPALDDTWRAASIDVMEGLPSEMIDDLADVEIDTLGKLSDRLDEGTLGDSIDLEAGMEDRIRIAIDNARAAILPASAAPDDSEWRGILLAGLDLSDALVAKLADAELRTVGELADYTASGKPLTDVPGIGEAKAAEIEEALVRFWDQRKSA